MGEIIPQVVYASIFYIEVKVPLGIAGISQQYLVVHFDSKVSGTRCDRELADYWKPISETEYYHILIY